MLGGALSFGDTSHRLVTLFEHTRQEQENLERTSPGATVVRHLNAGRLLGFQAAQELEKKLEVFFGPPVEQQRPPQPLRASM